MGDSSADDGELVPLGPCAEPLPSTSGKWYVEYYSSDDHECVQDCHGEHPCNGRPNSVKELYDTFSICCETHTYWKQDCAAHDEDGKASCDKDFWDSYFLTNPELGYSPNCECQLTSLGHVLNFLSQFALIFVYHT